MKRLISAALAAAALLVPVGPSAAQTAEPVPVALRFTTSPDPSAVGEEVVLSAFVTPQSGSAKPTGTVTFKEGPAPLGEAAVDENGTATLTVAFPAPGDHALTAAYSGDDAHAPASVPSTHTVDVAVSRKQWVPGAAGAWSKASNWEPPGPPVDGDTVVLTSGAGMGESVLDLAGLTLAHISVQGAGHRVATASGFSGVELTGGIHDDSTGGAVLHTNITLPDGAHVVDGAVTLGRAVSGAGGITKSGPGTLVLLTGNSYGGATSVMTGIVSAGHSLSLGASGTGTSVAEGASLHLHSGGPEPLTLEGALHFAGAGDHNAPVELQGDQVTISSSTALARMSGVVSGPARLRKTGAGTLTIGPADWREENTYEGGTDVAEGTLRPDGFIHSLGDGPVDVRTGAVLDPSQSLPLENHVRMEANSALVSSDGGAVRGELTLDGPVVIRNDSWKGLSLVGVISGSGPIRKEGSGPLWLTGHAPNTMTGAITVAEGSLLPTSRWGHVSAPDGVIVNKGATATFFGDDQLGDTAALVVHGSAVWTGTGDRFGSLTATGSVGLSGHYFKHDKRADFGIVSVDSVHLVPGRAALTVAVEPSLAPPSAGQTHDLLRVGGTVSLGGRLYLNGHVPWGSTVTIIDNTGTAPVSGTFDNVPQGAQVPTILRPTFINYRGGDGNDVTLTTPPARSGYWMLGADGAVYPFGQARHLGDAVGRLGGARAVDLEPTTTHNGYWILLDDGRVLAFGDAPAHGSASSKMEPGERATTLSNNRINGYWVFTDRGRAIPLGTDRHFGDMSGVALNGPILASEAEAYGWGYSMVGSDGGLFAFGSAEFHGSMGGTPLNGPVVGLASDPDATGYWLVATDGGIFAFEAPFRGSMGGRALNRPVVGMVAYGDGYLMVGSDGGIFNFSSKPFHGSLGSNPPGSPITSAAPINEL